MERDTSIEAVQDPMVIGVDVPAEIVDPEVEAIINRGYRGLVRDIFRDKDINPTPEELADCRVVLEADLARPDYPERGRKVISLRYGIDGQPPLSLRPTARELGNITTERVRQLHAREIRRIQHRSRGIVGALSEILGREPSPIGSGNERMRSRDTL